ncbi:MAG TPA: hypothetical protein VFT67_10055 [Jatrophihabitantaceae bacterium]|nr:hypothetical protein [Jatrophihabitantaceae bacterium]
MSAFESDPVVKAVRAWADQAAKTVNSGHYTDKALQALMTPALAKTMKNILGGVVGQHFPGPLPFTPISTKQLANNQRELRGCLQTNGFGLDPKTGKPAHKRVVSAFYGDAVRSGGIWKVSALDHGSFSCTGVRIPEVKW